MAAVAGKAYAKKPGYICILWRKITPWRKK
jgi:hypothetical protein